MGFFTQENNTVERNIEKVIEKTVSITQNQFGNNLLSLLLIGSYARNEGIWKIKDDGYEIISDLDLFAVTRNWSKTPDELFNAINEIEKKNEVKIDLKIKSLIKLKFFPRDTHTYDIKYTGRVIYGIDVRKHFPIIKQTDIGEKDIVFLFFNRALLSIEELSPQILQSQNNGDLEKISHEASKTFFTCADLITINFGSYHPSIISRINKIRKLMPNVNLKLENQEFLSDLERAYNFKYKNQDELYINDAFTLWQRGKKALLTLFKEFILRKNNLDNIIQYPIFEKRKKFEELSIYKILKSIKSRQILWKQGVIPTFPKGNIGINCKMAVLMLYLALDQKIDQKYVKNAENYLNKVRLPLQPDKKFTNKWTRLQNELIDYHKMGVF